MVRFLNRLSCLLGVFFNLYVLFWVLFIFYPLWLAQSSHEIELYGHITQVSKFQKLNRILFSINDDPLRFDAFFNEDNHNLLFSEFSPEEALRVVAIRVKDGHYLVKNMDSNRWELNPKTLNFHHILWKYGSLFVFIFIVLLTFYWMYLYFSHFRHLRWMKNVPKYERI